MHRITKHKMEMRGEVVQTEGDIRRDREGIKETTILPRVWVKLNIVTHNEQHE